MVLVKTLVSATVVTIGSVLAVVFAAVSSAVFKFLSENRDQIQSALTLLAIAVAIGTPICIDQRDRRRNAHLAKDQLRLYLKVLRDKINRILDEEPKKQAAREAALADGTVWGIERRNKYPDLLLVGLPPKGEFEKDNKTNHDIVERLVVESQSLKYALRKQLFDFVKNLKTMPAMERAQDFRQYLDPINRLLGELGELAGATISRPGPSRHPRVPRPPGAAPR
jgi:hypothetical protein